MRIVNSANLLCWSLLLLGVAGIRFYDSATSDSTPVALNNTMIRLSPPILNGKVSVEHSLFKRRSIRRYSSLSLTDQEISQLLWAAQGITSTDGYRTAPSAGALFPLTIYLATAQGLFIYYPQGHKLEQIETTDVRKHFWSAGLQQDSLLQAPALFIFCADIAKTAIKYKSMAQRYVTLEVGHASENLLLQATALNLGSLVIGAFDENSLHQTTPIPHTLTIMEIVTVGRKRS